MDFGERSEMPVVFGVNKMFGKNKQNKEMKLVDKDVGFAEDSFELIKQACGDEAHCVGNFVINPCEENLQEMNSSRSRRTKIMGIVIEAVGANVENQDWCRIKHICTEAMHIQEDMVRLSSQNIFEMAKEISTLHKECYLKFLNLLGFSKENLNHSTSA